MSEKSILAGIFRMGDQAKRNLRDLVSNPRDYLEGVAHQNNLEWKKNPDERSMGFFNPVPLGTLSPFMLRKQMKEAVEDLPSLSRRDFMKKGAGLAGGTAAASIPGAKLLQKFAPEERAVVKQAAVETAPKYKYNSLKDYLDDVEQNAHEMTQEFAHDLRYAAPDDWYQANRNLSWKNSKQFEDELNSFNKDMMRERLLHDELAYNEAKRNLSSLNPKKDFNTGLPPQSQRELIDAFSPQAKEQMRSLKDYAKHQYDGTWIDVIQNESDTIMPYILY